VEKEDEKENGDGEMTKKKTPCLENAMTNEEEEVTKPVTPRTKIDSNNTNNTLRKIDFT
jgi:hypothetical protein